MCWIECNGDFWKVGLLFDLVCIGVNVFCCYFVVFYCEGMKLCCERKDF